MAQHLDAYSIVGGDLVWFSALTLLVTPALEYSVPSSGLVQMCTYPHIDTKVVKISLKEIVLVK